MIKVCDAIMGSGKSSAAINYMNNHPDQKFIYITPYLDEVKRIREKCSELHFVEPNNINEKYFHRKLIHASSLIQEGRNIASTHELFKNYTLEMLSEIKKQEYTLIIDENIEILESTTLTSSDVSILKSAGIIYENDLVYNLTEKGREFCDRLPHGERWKNLLEILKTRPLVKVNERDDEKKAYYWMLTPEFLTSFKDAFILTYLLEGQSIYYFLKINNIGYSPIYIKEMDGRYEFSDLPTAMPEYVRNLRSVLNVVTDHKINDIGEEEHALSMNWFAKNPEGSKLIQNHLSNYFTHIFRDTPANKRMWSTYKSTQNKLKGKGYTKSFLVFNSRATNAYKDRTVLAYPVNLYLNVGVKLFYKHFGAEASDDLYALSTMLQWVWRSAIRDGEAVHLYVPSRRMRELLLKWIDEVTTEANAA